MHTHSARSRAIRFATPTAVIGTLAAVLTAAPADADELRRTEVAPPRLHVTPPPVAQTAPVRHASTRPTTYTVRPGDTVSAIAIRNGLRPADVLAWNGLGWRSVIYPGQTLRLTAPAAPKPAAAPAAKPAPQAAAKTHTVVRGDTVYAIARKYGTTVAKVIAANGLGRSATIFPGQKLKVGGAAAAAPAPAAAPAAPAAPAASAKPAAHTVVAGDTLFAIARKYGTTVAVLLQANGLGNGSIIYPGQSLRLTPPAPAQRFASLDAVQRGHAQHIIRVGRELGVPDRGIAIALATAMVESSMRNLDFGDRDSLGLFQQRPSQGWGTPAQIMDADRSIRVFYGGPHDPNGDVTRGLLDISGWQTRAFTAAAQAVQVSAFPDRYGQWEQQANSWLASLG
ncbi:LysM peptidoglycan-binding domain-containing protein [Microbacterium sp. YJN-G]|uniref:LysM peptidoglycan-binding domain-containing protein n=1 Tax=Microbacterium sp. YJN-G TaxID=2763257 RepID=UPI0018783300|nr:LysM peptidoglycan-binding domain-containing protein [Microbacterium sp. YJN-G]